MEPGFTVMDAEGKPVAFYSSAACGGEEAAREAAEMEEGWQPMGERERAMYEASLERTNRWLYPSRYEDEEKPEEEWDSGEARGPDVRVPFQPTEEEAEEVGDAISSRKERLRGSIVTERNRTRNV